MMKARNKVPIYCNLVGKYSHDRGYYFDFDNLGYVGPENILIYTYRWFNKEHYDRLVPLKKVENKA